MNTNEVKEIIKDSWEEILSQITRPARSKVNGRTSYICPLCDHGQNGDGITVDPTSKEGNGLKCFGCGFSGDIIALIGEKEGISYFPDQLKRAGEYIGITIDEPGTPRKPSSPLADKKAQPVDQKEEISQLSFYREAQSHLKETDYHTQRGISEAIANRYMLGYIPNWKHPKKPNAPASPRLIIPVSEYTYIARDTREELTPEQEKYKKQKARMTTQEKANWIFNVKALQTAQKPIVVTEGELDALSIIEVGGEAIAIGSTAYINAFAEYVTQQPPAQPLILAMDNDASGLKATEELEAKLKEAGIYPYRAELYGRCKDANELLVKDRKALTRAIQQAEQEAYRHEEERKEEALKAYRGEYSAKAHLQGFIDGIADSVNTPMQPTGFDTLDAELGEGLKEGLYFLGAISSLGKTTFCLQMCDQIAQSGRDVLIFSLEMARNELLSKSISRLTYINTIAEGGNIANAKSTLGISTGSRYQRYTQTEKNLIARSIEAYNSYADHVYIIEGKGDIKTADISQMVKRHIDATGNKPVVLVDYLQIITPADIRMTDKQSIDRNVTQLKQLSVEYKIPVIGISSVNRNNYLMPIDFESFKESGSVEFSADVVIGLQLACLEDDIFNTNAQSKIKEKRERIRQAKEATPREIEAVILKNRNGKTGGKIKYNYYSKFNYFEEIGRVEEAEPKEEPKAEYNLDEYISIQ